MAKKAIKLDSYTIQRLSLTVKNGKAVAVSDDAGSYMTYFSHVPNVNYLLEEIDRLKAEVKFYKR